MHASSERWFFCVNRSLLSFAEEEGFKPSPDTPCAPLEKYGTANGGNPILQLMFGTHTLSR